MRSPTRENNQEKRHWRRHALNVQSSTVGSTRRGPCRLWATLGTLGVRWSPPANDILRNGKRSTGGGRC